MRFLALSMIKSLAGISVITVGDFFQLPPVGARPVYADYKNNWQNFESLETIQNF